LPARQSFRHAMESTTLAFPLRCPPPPNRRAPLQGRQSHPVTRPIQTGSILAQWLRRQIIQQLREFRCGTAPESFRRIERIGGLNALTNALCISCSSRSCAAHEAHIARCACDLFALLRLHFTQRKTPARSDLRPRGKTGRAHRARPTVYAIWRVTRNTIFHRPSSCPARAYRPHFIRICSSQTNPCPWRQTLLALQSAPEFLCETPARGANVGRCSSLAAQKRSVIPASRTPK